MNYQTFVPAPLPPAPKQQNDALCIAALACGVLTILTALIGTVYPPFIFASISITLAVLSKGYEKKLPPVALAGFITSLCGLALNVVVVVFSFYLVFSVPEFKEQLNNTCTELYGQSFDEIMEDALH